ncbi:TPA: Lrp/AsnC family transcriptional regulator [Candidatus Bathyarchaeota archaeon]|nr:Lrp/AsnC family transcriptional regulator [Candidatus Bathyarchaeota archaeon]
MNSVLVLITVEPTKEVEVLNHLQKLKLVTESHLLYGPYDLYAKAEAKTTAELERLVMNDIRNIKGIKSTMTCFIAD